jgi:hypothetical protein
MIVKRQTVQMLMKMMNLDPRKKDQDLKQVVLSQRLKEKN